MKQSSMDQERLLRGPDASSMKPSNFKKKSKGSVFRATSSRKNEKNAANGEGDEKIVIKKPLKDLIIPKLNFGSEWVSGVSVDEDSISEKVSSSRIPEFSNFRTKTDLNLTAKKRNQIWVENVNRELNQALQSPAARSNKIDSLLSAEEQSYQYDAGGRQERSILDKKDVDGCKHAVFSSNKTKSDHASLGMRLQQAKNPMDSRKENSGIKDQFHKNQEIGDQKSLKREQKPSKDMASNKNLVYAKKDSEPTKKRFNVDNNAFQKYRSLRENALPSARKNYPQSSKVSKFGESSNPNSEAYKHAGNDLRLHDLVQDYHSNVLKNFSKKPKLQKFLKNIEKMHPLDNSGGAGGQINDSLRPNVVQTAQFLTKSSTKQSTKNNLNLEFLKDQESADSMFLWHARHDDAENALTLLKNPKFEFDVDLNKIDEQGWGAIHYAAMHENIRFLNLLLYNDADPNLVGRGGLTPLFISIIK